MTDPAVTWWIAFTSRSRPCQRCDDGCGKELDEEDEEFAAVIDEESDEMEDEGDGDERAAEQARVGLFPRILIGRNEMWW